jgi:hypothetical protein
MLTVLRDANECRGGEYKAREGKKTRKEWMLLMPSKQMNNERTGTKLKIVIWDDDLASTVATNPALAGAGEAVLGSAGRVTHYVKAG